MQTLAIPKPLPLEYLPKEFKVSVWSKLKPYYKELLNRPVHTISDLERWILDLSELEAVVGEEFAWRYIRITVDSKDQKALELYQYAIRELSPYISSLENKLKKKLVGSHFANRLDKGKYAIFLRSVHNEVALFSEENIPLETEMKMQSKEHGKVFSEMTVMLDGQELTLQEASVILEETDRARRELVYHKMGRRMLLDSEKLDQIFDELLQLRHQIALNAGFDNFRDFKFQDLGRFDYDVSDCFDFHDSIAHEILPIVEELDADRQKVLGLEKLRPWDMEVDRSGKVPLRPFADENDLIEKSIQCLSSLHPFFGDCLSIMREMKHLDLGSRKGKRPGGYNMPLHLTGVPYIFMNAANSASDMRTLMHESGHAVHSFLTRNFRLTAAKRLPSEVAELAAMTMELLSMDCWGIFFEKEDDLQRAKIWQLENVLNILPWIATIDKFQHWIYTNPTHSCEERKKAWLKIYGTFRSKVIDMDGLGDQLEYRWQKQLHIFEAPFYYIEYGMAQLGAIAIWKQYRENPQRAIENYCNALKLGYTRPIGEIYEAAGIEFNFSREYVAELGAFVRRELEQLI